MERVICFTEGRTYSASIWREMDITKLGIKLLFVLDPICLSLNLQIGPHRMI